ncbi:uncharacterized protein [Hoplias malabaricus]|uniref:uncharacterized protein n=1 Tax=Hoplias malabaricus TaxID=27720 RepID=UPI003461D2BF
MGNWHKLPFVPAMSFVSVIVLIVQVQLTLGSCTNEELKTYYTTGGEACRDACDKHGYNYFWCRTISSWDYCSERENYDYNGLKCKSSHPCGKYGKTYYWCKTNKGESECGLMEPKTVLYKTKYNDLCVTDCYYAKFGKYYWCYTKKGWDYCSPARDVTYRNEPCRWDHSCGSNGKNYNWCYTKSSWDYCGYIDPCECSYYSSQRSKRDTNKELFSCTQTINGDKFITTFNAEPFFGSQEYDSSIRNEITNLISKWKDEYLSNQTSEKLDLITDHNSALNLELKGNTHYHLKVTANSSQGHKVLVSQVLIPTRPHFPGRYIRMALLESFHNHAIISMETSECEDKEQTG